MSDDDSKSTSDDTPKAPIKLNVPEGTSHKVEKPMVGSWLIGKGAWYTRMVESSDLRHQKRRSPF